MSFLVSEFFFFQNIYDWITIIGYGKHEISSNKHVVLPKTKFVILDILLHYLPITATFFCPQARVAVKLLQRGSVALFTEVGFLEYFLGYSIVVYLPNQIVVC